MMKRIEESPYGPGDLWRRCAVKPVMILFLCILLSGSIAPLFAAPPPKAAEMDKLEMVKEALEKGEDINGRDSAGNTLLMAAAGVGEFRVVKYLIEKGADANAVGHEGQTALLWALSQFHFEIARYLLQKGADVNLAVSALHKLSAEAAAVTTVAFYLDTDTLSLAFAKGLNDSSKDFLWSNVGLCLVTPSCKPEAIKLFLEKGANVNLDLGEGATPLMAAAQAGKLDIVRLLIDKGANVNVRNTRGITALKAAEKAKSNKEQIIAVLRRAGAKE